MKRSFVNYVPWSFSLVVVFLIAVLLLPLLYILFTRAVISSFQKLGFSFFSGFIIFLSIIFGSVINIPVKTLTTRIEMFNEGFVNFFGISYRIPTLYLQETVISLNLGGAIIPTIISIYEFIRLLVKGNMWTIVSVFISLTFVTFVIYLLAKPVKGLGIAIPIFVPPLVTVLITLILRPLFAPAVAYISGTLGTLIGADLLNLKKIPELGAPIVSIGGAGTFDGIFLTGIISVLLI